MNKLKSLLLMLIIVLSASTLNAAAILAIPAFKFISSLVAAGGITFYTNKPTISLDSLSKKENVETENFADATKLGADYTLHSPINSRLSNEAEPAFMLAKETIKGKSSYYYIQSYPNINSCKEHLDKLNKPLANGSYIKIAGQKLSEVESNGLKTVVRTKINSGNQINGHDQFITSKIVTCSELCTCISINRSMAEYGKGNPSNQQSNTTTNPINETTNPM